MDRRRRIDAIILVGLSTPLILVLATPVITRFLLRGGSFEQLRTLNSRTELWSDAATEIGESPLLGRGYFAARELFLDSIGLGGAHNAFVEIAVSAGLLGMAAFMWLVGSATLELWRLREHPQQPLLAALFVAALVNAISAGYLAQAGTGANVMFLVTLGWIAALGRPRSDASASHSPPTARRR
jgi:O-antigen ligase